MANIVRWSGEGFKVTFGNKANNNTGISHVIIDAANYTYLDIAESGKVSSLSYYDGVNSALQTTSTALRYAASTFDTTNTGRSNTTTSVATIYTKEGVATNQAEKVKFGIQFTDAANPYIENVSHTLMTYNVATALTMSSSKTEVWNDSTFTITVKPKDGSRTSSTAAAVSISPSNTAYFAAASGKTNTAITFTPKSVSSPSGYENITFTATHSGGKASDAAYLTNASKTISGTVTVKVKTAVQSVTLKNAGEDTHYIPVGKTDELSYVITVKGSSTVSGVAAKPFSSVVTLTSPDDNKSENEKVAVATLSGANKFKVTGKKVGSVLFTLTSSAASTAKTDTLRVYVTAASSTVILNTSDKWSSTIGEGIAKGDLNIVGENSIIAVALSNGKLTVTGLKPGSASVTLPGGAKFDITITNISVTIEDADGGAVPTTTPIPGTTGTTTATPSTTSSGK